jgi:hypothetical protein
MGNDTEGVSLERSLKRMEDRLSEGLSFVAEGEEEEEEEGFSIGLGRFGGMRAVRVAN